jgi:hypothetical protein
MVLKNDSAAWSYLVSYSGDCLDWVACTLFVSGSLMTSKKVLEIYFFYMSLNVQAQTFLCGTDSGILCYNNSKVIIRLKVEFGRRLNIIA